MSLMSCIGSEWRTDHLVYAPGECDVTGGRGRGGLGELFDVQVPPSHTSEDLVWCPGHAIGSLRGVVLRFAKGACLPASHVRYL